MRKLFTLVALFAGALVLALGFWLPYSRKSYHVVLPRRVELPSDPPRSPTHTVDDRCERGDWRACAELAESDEPRRGVHLARVEWLLGGICHGRVIHADRGRTSIPQACGHLAALRMNRSPRLARQARECVRHAVQHCDDYASDANSRCLAEELPGKLLRRPEWGRWCEQGDELACRIDAAL